MIVNEAFLVAESFNFVRKVAVVREVLMRPFELLFTVFTNVMLREPDLPVIEHVALRALETVNDNFLLVGRAFGLKRRDSEDFGLAIVLANFNTGRL